jgi:hypothetical protein
MCTHKLCQVPWVFAAAGWDFWYVTISLQPFVAPKRAMPRQALVMQRYRAGALVYALQDCSGFVVSTVQSLCPSARDSTASQPPIKLVQYIFSIPQYSKG